MSWQSPTRPRRSSGSCARHPIEPGQGTVTGRVAAYWDATVYIPDVENEPGYQWVGNRASWATIGPRWAFRWSRTGKPWAVITLAHGELDGFSRKQIGLIETFAAQAVIALSTTPRLFHEPCKTAPRGRGGTGAAEGQRRDPQCHQPVGRGRAAGVREDPRQLSETVWR